LLILEIENLLQIRLAGLFDIFQRFNLIRPSKGWHGMKQEGVTRTSTSNHKKLRIYSFDYHVHLIKKALYNAKTALGAIWLQQRKIGLIYQPKI